MYLPEEAQKSFTAAFVALGGVVSRTATNAVKSGSQIADRFTYQLVFGETKKDSIPVFSYFVKIIKIESKYIIIQTIK